VRARERGVNSPQTFRNVLLRSVHDGNLNRRRRSPRWGSQPQPRRAGSIVVVRRGLC